MERNILSCDCKNDIFYGVPCHHQIAIALKSPRFPLTFLPFASRWRLDYFKVEEEELKGDEIIPNTANKEVVFLL